MNILHRVPRLTLWLLQHPLDDAETFALSWRLREELATPLHMKQLVVMKRQPLEKHVRRTGLADVVLDTWPYTAHTTVADAIWRDGLPWLALGAADGQSGRMDALLSSACLTAVGAQPLVQTSRKGFEDFAIALASQGPRVIFTSLRFFRQCLFYSTYLASDQNII